MTEERTPYVGENDPPTPTKPSDDYLHRTYVHCCVGLAKAAHAGDSYKIGLYAGAADCLENIALAEGIDLRKTGA